MPVADLAAPDSALFLWATFPQLPEALRLIEAWGFTYKSVAFVWLKKNKKAGGRGFTAIIVAWLAKFNTFFMVAITLLIIFLNRGASEIASKFALNEYASNIITGIILFFILGCEFFITYKLNFRKSAKEA